MIAILGFALLIVVCFGLMGAGMRFGVCHSDGDPLRRSDWLFVAFGATSIAIALAAAASQIFGGGW